LLGLIASATGLRLIGFASVIIGDRVPSVLALQFVALAAAMAAGLVQISRGRTIEHSTLITQIFTAIGNRIARATAS
jgi:hypothetical protein